MSALKSHLGGLTPEAVAAGVVAWARANGSDTDEVRDAAHEASHALELGAKQWHRESIHSRVMRLGRVGRARTEVVARAVEQLVCEALGVQHDWPHFMLLCGIEAMKSGVTFPDFDVLTAMVEDAKKAPGVLELADRIIRDGARAASPDVLPARPTQAIQEDLRQATARRAAADAVRDASVKRLTKAGNSPAEVAKALGMALKAVKASMARQGLEAPPSVRLTERRLSDKTKHRKQGASNG